MRSPGASKAAIALSRRQPNLPTTSNLSGGLSLKTNDGMKTMKMDMSGAAAVLAAMTTLRALKCKSTVTGYMMCTDNMPSGSAVKMGDVLTVRGGTTVEVLNTDAEGRLVLADTLAYADTVLRPDAMVNIATLTGAARIALGTSHGAMYATDEANRFLEVTYQNGDKEILFFKDFSSGAMIENIVRRAKKLSIKRTIAGGTRGIGTQDLLDSIKQEFREHEDLPNTTNPDDWAKISGKKGERIVFIRTLVKGRAEADRHLPHPRIAVADRSASCGSIRPPGQAM